MLKIGFQSHIVLRSSRKLYCSCVPDQEHCSVCRGEPGALVHRVSYQALRKALCVAVALNAKVNPVFQSFRKHYRYYDLPNGYQRTQHPSKPLFSEASLYLINNRTTLRCKGYLEQDPAALKKNNLDFRRCGSPLLQLVTDCHQIEESKVASFVKQYFRTLKRLVLDLQIASKVKTLKTDLNISIEGSPRYEIKNLSSLKDLLGAIPPALELLKIDVSGTPKTFHFKKELVFSRQKKKYLFSKQWNHPLVRILKLPKIKRTLPRMYLQKQRTNPHPLNYAFLKKLFSQWDKKNLTEEELLVYSQRDPKIGLKELQIKLKSSDILKKEVLQYVKGKFDSKDFFEKTRLFLDTLNGLKRYLSSKEVSFSSYSINTILQEKFEVQK